MKKNKILLQFMSLFALLYFASAQTQTTGTTTAGWTTGFQQVGATPAAQTTRPGSYAGSRNPSTRSTARPMKYGTYSATDVAQKAQRVR